MSRGRRTLGRGVRSGGGGSDLDALRVAAELAERGVDSERGLFRGPRLADLRDGSNHRVAAAYLTGAGRVLVPCRHPPIPSSDALLWPPWTFDALPWSDRGELSPDKRYPAPVLLDLLATLPGAWRELFCRCGRRRVVVAALVPRTPDRPSARPPDITV